MAVQWRFYGGCTTIGGTIICIEKDGWQLVFDLGRAVDRDVPVFDDVIRERGAADLVRMGVAPNIPGLFDDDSSAAAHTLVAISHAHLDHMAFLPWLRHDIPVLVSAETHLLIKALDESLDGPQAGVRYTEPDAQGRLTFGPFSIQMVPVDHDTPGACALLIDTGDMRFAYSADLRLHGLHPERTYAFAKRAREFCPHVLWIEGTRAEAIDNSNTDREADLPQRIRELVQCETGPVFFNFYPRHPERLQAFVEGTRATGRQVAVTAATAYIFEQFGGDLRNCVIYANSSQGHAPTVQDWLAAQSLRTIGPDDVRNMPERYVVELPYAQLRDLIDIEPPANGLYILSNGHPLGPYDRHWPNLQYWLQTFGLRTASAYSTGHACRTEIGHLIDMICPDVLMPIHSRRPELIGTPTIRRILPVLHRIYTSADLEQAQCPDMDVIGQDSVTVSV
jgi:ribonuclease J